MMKATIGRSNLECTPIREYCYPVMDNGYVIGFGCRSDGYGVTNRGWCSFMKNQIWTNVDTGYEVELTDELLTTVSHESVTRAYTNVLTTKGIDMMTALIAGKNPKEDMEPETEMPDIF